MYDRLLSDGAAQIFSMRVEVYVQPPPPTYEFSCVFCYTSCFQLIARSTSSEKLGAANGVGQSAAGLARMVGPVLGSLSVAWSLTNGLPSPFDYHFIFVVLFAVNRQRSR